MKTTGIGGVLAAHRLNVPLRETAKVCLIDDGTMCRMPTPRPGPLRGQSDDRLSEATISVDGAPFRTHDSVDVIKISALPIAAHMAA